MAILACYGRPTALGEVTDEKIATDKYGTQGVPDTDEETNSCVGDPPALRTALAKIFIVIGVADMLPVP